MTQTGGKLTLIIVRRMLAEPKRALAGVMLETSFARFRPSMAIPREERIRSRPFESLGSMTIVKTGGGRRKKTWHTGFEEKAES